jgi:hypothetical protein
MAQFFEGTPAVLSEQAPVRALRTGILNMPIAAAASSVDVPDARVNDTSIIVITPLGAADATGKVFSISAVTNNVGFTVHCSAQLTAAKNVRWAVLQY